VERPGPEWSPRAAERRRSGGGGGGGARAILVARDRRSAAAPDAAAMPTAELNLASFPGDFLQKPSAID